MTKLSRYGAIIISVAVLSALALGIAGFLIRNDVFVYGDNPGQYWRMWYTLNISWPLHHRLLDWIPYWYAGYPELQFYPPGFVIVGWLMNLMTLGRLSTALIYQLVMFLAYALPGLTFYYAVYHWGFGRRAAFAAGVFGLVFPTFLDGATGLFIGMLGSRISFALDGIVLAWTIDYLEGHGARYAFLSALALAFAILAHPYHEIGIVLALSLYILVRRLPLLHNAMQLLKVIFLASALAAFWLIPLAVYSSTAMVPVIRSTLDQTWHLLTDQTLLPYVLLALPTVVRAWHEQDPLRRGVLCVLLALPPVLGATMILTHLVLINRVHFYQLDPFRLIGEVYFALILSAAVGVSQISDWLVRFRWIKRKPFATAAITSLLCILSAIPFTQASIFFHPKDNDEPRFLSQAITDYHLNDFWGTLRASTGRILFTSFYGRLVLHGTEPFPSTLPALTPLFTNRQIMGGTFTEQSPIAGFMRSGETNPPVLWGLSENQDDQALFGTPLGQLSDKKLFEFCQHFNITTLVAGATDIQTRTFLDASPLFQSYYNDGQFFVYRVKGYGNSWVDSYNAQIEVARFEDDEIQLHVHAAQTNAQVTVKDYAYPLWHAYINDSGRELPITKDALALTHIALPLGEDYSVTLSYEESKVTELGNSISLASVVLFAIVGAYAYRNERQRMQH